MLAPPGAPDLHSLRKATEGSTLGGSRWPGELSPSCVRGTDHRCGALGAGCAAGSLALARMADDGELLEACGGAGLIER